MRRSEADRLDEGGGELANHAGVQTHQRAREVLLAVRHSVPGAR